MRTRFQEAGGTGEYKGDWWTLVAQCKKQGCQYFDVSVMTGVLLPT